jgi:hypothetical protein
VIVYSNKTKPYLQKCQFGIKFAIVIRLKIPVTEIKSACFSNFVMVLVRFPLY